MFSYCFHIYIERNNFKFWNYVKNTFRHHFKTYGDDILILWFWEKFPLEQVQNLHWMSIKGVWMTPMVDRSAGDWSKFQW